MEQCDHNCEGTICSTAQMYEQWPNEPKTINLLESGLETKLSMSEVESDHNRLVTITGKNKTKSFEQKSSSWSSPRYVCSYILFLDLYKNFSSWVHSNFSLVFLIIPFCNGALLFYIPSTSFISALHV